jgi:hypothetical protein
MTGQMGQSNQSAARPADSKELTLPLDQTFLQFALCSTEHTLKERLNKLLNVCGFFPFLWEGLGEGAKLGAHKPSPQPSPKGRGRKTSN